MNTAYYWGNINREFGGVYTYSVGILHMLLKEKSITNIYLIISKGQIDNIPDDIKSHPKVVLVKDNVYSSKIKRISKGLSNVLFDLSDVKKSKGFKKLKTFAICLDPYVGLIDSLGAEILHIPLQVAPGYGMKTPVIITMHDMQELLFPEYFSPDIRLWRALHYKRTIEQSDHIIVSFNHVKDDIVRLFGISSEKVSVCPIPFTDTWFQVPGISEKEELLKKYLLPQEFILYPAKTWAHKNHKNLFVAISKLKEKGHSINLVCTGGLTNYFNTLQEEMNNLQIRDQVKFLGLVPEQDLIGLYKIAKLVVIPTLYEAGSGPLFEAMRHEVPVICSNVTSLPESIGNEEFIFNPNDPDEIAGKIEKGFYDIIFRQNNIENSRKRMSCTGDTNYSQRFFDAYRKAIKTKK